MAQASIRNQPSIIPVFHNPRLDHDDRDNEVNPDPRLVHQNGLSSPPPVSKIAAATTPTTSTATSRKTPKSGAHPPAPAVANPEIPHNPSPHGGFDIIDHAFGPNFPQKLLNELRSHGWIEDPVRGTKGRMTPSRTKMEVDMANLLGALIKSDVVLEENANSTGDGKGGRGVRGDESAFLPREERQKATFPEKYPFLHRLVSSIECTACNHLGKSRIALNQNNDGNEDYFLSDFSAYFEFDKSMTSVQISRYPGDGEAGYPRHCDSGKTCLKEPADSSWNEKIDTKMNAVGRILTLVYYLTPAGWDTDLDGGALRIFSPCQPVMMGIASVMSNNDERKKSGNEHEETNYFASPRVWRTMAQLGRRWG